MEENFAQIKARARALREEAQAIRSSSSYARVVGVLSGLGFLIAPGIKPLPTSKVELEEAIAIGKAVEPRILEVLPAAVLSFPKSFLHIEKSPENFKEVVSALKCGKAGPDFEGVSFKKLREAANRPTKNGRRKLLAERRIPKTFRFSPEVIDAMKEQARRRGSDYTTYIEMLIRRDSGLS